MTYYQGKIAIQSSNYTWLYCNTLSIQQFVVQQQNCTSMQNFTSSPHHKQEIELARRQIDTFTAQYRIQHVNYHTWTGTENRLGRKRQALSNNNSHLNRSICSPSHDLILNMDKVNYILSGGQRRLAEFQIRGLLTSYNWFSLFNWIRESPVSFRAPLQIREGFLRRMRSEPRCI